MVLRIATRRQSACPTPSCYGSIPQRERAFTSRDRILCRTPMAMLPCLRTSGRTSWSFQALYGSPDISGPECTFYRRPRFDNRQPYRAGGAEAEATAQSERTRPWLLANRFQAISQASMMSARLENTELASQ